MEYQTYLDALTESDNALGRVVSTWRNLEVILKRHGEAGGSLHGCDIVQQDECSYDFLLPLADTRWLAFSVS